MAEAAAEAGASRSRSRSRRRKERGSFNSSGYPPESMEDERWMMYRVDGDDMGLKAAVWMMGHSAWGRDKGRSDRGGPFLSFFPLHTRSTAVSCGAGRYQTVYLPTYACQCG